MSELFGTFSEPGSLSTGDPYRKRQGMVHSTWHHAVSANNSCVVLLGDRYTDAWILEKRLSRIPGKPVSDKPFYRTVGSNSSITCGPGSNDGVISKEMPYDTDGSAAALRSNAPRRPADKLRNIYTVAPKKGGYGMPWRDMSLGEPPKYYMDVYDGGRQREKEMRATGKPVSVKEAKYHAKEHAAVKPFRPVSGSKARLSMWSPNPYTTAARPAPDIDFTIT
ncbi:flagellar associated protein [Scenedesmus sp. NREL 46B-D3]|nr:flagellar associated protein [Scenedesmus sp. NREL 46B-D3]